MTIATYFNGQTTKDIMRRARELDMSLDDLIRQAVENELHRLEMKDVQARQYGLATDDWQSHD